MRNSQILIVSAVKICKQRLQTASPLDLSCRRYILEAYLASCSIGLWATGQLAFFSIKIESKKRKSIYVLQHTLNNRVALTLVVTI